MTLKLLALGVIFSSCSVGPVVSNVKELPLPSQLEPSPPVTKTDGLYFRVISNSPAGVQVSQIADRIYQKILAEIKLTESLRRPGLTPLYVYRSRSEFLEKSGMPPWSDGVFQKEGILIYMHWRLPETLAHEIAHLIFWEYFGGFRSDLLWLNEGLAMHAESQARSEQAPTAYKTALPVLRGRFLPLTQLTQTASAIEHKDRDAQVFYVESWLLVQFLLERGGPIGFYELLWGLKEHLPLDAAIARAFPGKWKNLSELELGLLAEYPGVK